MFLSCLTYTSQVKVQKGQYLTEKQGREDYALYALNIDPRWCDAIFGAPGESFEMTGINKSYKSGIKGVIFRTVTMKTSNEKYRVVIYRGEGAKYVQDSFESDTPNNYEVVRIMRERATGEAQEKVFLVEDEQQ